VGNPAGGFPARYASLLCFPCDVGFTQGLASFSSFLEAVAPQDVHIYIPHHRWWSYVCDVYVSFLLHMSWFCQGGGRMIWWNHLYVRLWSICCCCIHNSIVSHHILHSHVVMTWVFLWSGLYMLVYILCCHVWFCCVFSAETVFLLVRAWTMIRTVIISVKAAQVNSWLALGCNYDCVQTPTQRPHQWYWDFGKEVVAVTGTRLTNCSIFLKRTHWTELP